MHDPERVAKIRSWLAERDSALAHMHARLPPLTWRSRPGGFPGLLRLITEQQVSTASAAAIWGRLQAGLGEVTPEAVLAHDEAALKSYGLSTPKARYARAVAQAHSSGEVNLDAGQALDDEAAITAMLRLKGVGRWTAEVYLLFCEGRLDVFPAGDLALQEGLRVADGAHARPTEKALNARSQAWRPYRGVAAHLIWSYYAAVRRKTLAASQAALKETV